MIRPDSVNALDLVAESDRFVDNELKEVVWRALSREKLELEVDRPGPSNDDTRRDL